VTITHVRDVQQVLEQARVARESPDQHHRVTVGMTGSAPQILKMLVADL
jgi:hypothetical protein